MQRILVLGGGFAGLWSAVGAARKLDELGIGSDQVEVTLVNRDAYHNIRVRNYETDLSQVRVPLDEVLQPVGITRVEGDVVDIHHSEQIVDVRTSNGQTKLNYDRLVFALGSLLVRPDIPGLAQFAFDVDTYHGAVKLNEHLHVLPRQSKSTGQFTVLVIGAGLTGIEVATEMPGRLREILQQAGRDDPFRVILADRNPRVGSDMGESARPVIEQALAALGVETRVGIDVVSVDSAGATLKSGDQIPAATVIWCAGMRANPLTQQFLVERDYMDRLPVDEFLHVKGVPNVFAAGDVASAMVDRQHSSVMSCQHGRPMGRFAGHNVVCDLLGLPMLSFSIDYYVTVLDLGSWGAVCTAGWDRHVVAQGADAKRTKQTINCRRIYPPLSRNRAEILAAAAPIIQRPPETDS